MSKNIFYIILISFSSVFFQSCEFQTAKKIQDPEKKYEKAVEYYELGKYAKTQILLDDVILSLRMTKSGEEALYKFADTYYHLKDYILAGYYFRKYVSDYPKGKYAEEAQFMSARCYYLDAPRPTLDQQATYTALKEFELFITKYPNSEKIEDCNKMVDDLIDRLQTKSFLNAKLYYDREYYNAAAVALKNSLKDYPDTKYKEEIMYLIVMSKLKYAKNSIVSKKKERYEDALKEFDKFVEKYPESKYLKEIKSFKQNAEKELKELNKTETVSIN